MSRYIRIMAGATNDLVLVLSNSTDVVVRAQQIHKTSQVVTAALGRTLTATHLMGTYLKGDKTSVSLQIHGSAALKKIYAYADGSGHLKGYVSNPELENKVKPNGKLDVSGIIGKYGKLMVTRDMGFGQPFMGQSDLVSGEIAEDLAYYYAHSEQQPSIFSLGVLVGNDDIPIAAGGLMLQTLPDCAEESIAALEARLPSFRPMSEMIAVGMTLEQIADELLGDIPHHFLEEGTFNYTCDCSHSKIESALSTLGIGELQSILQEEGHMEMTCHFCDRKYHYDDKALKHLIAQLKAQKEH